MFIKCKLNILEPWKFGTERAVDVIILEENVNQILISISKPLHFDNDQVEYLIAELKDKKDLANNESFAIPGTYPVNMVFSNEISPKNFKDLKFEDFRSNFLFGEIIIS